MSAIDLAVSRLKTEEGFRAKKYVDTVGNETIGYGFAIGAGLTEPEAGALLQAQVTTRAAAIGTWWFQALDDARASVVLDVAFNLGVEGLFAFKDMIAAIQTKNWQAAHDALLDSQAARQLPTRYAALANLLLTGGSS
jgi:lysozyme